MSAINNNQLFSQIAFNNRREELTADDQDKEVDSFLMRKMEQVLEPKEWEEKGTHQLNQITELKNKAEKGGIYALCRLGEIYEEGLLGIEQSYEEAFVYYKRAADLGDAFAQRKVGYMYENGLGVEASDKEAFEQYSKAANQGDATAQYCLGLMYEYGQGVEASTKMAFEFYLKAAIQNDAEAQYRLALLFESGDGVEQSDTQALYWCQKSASRGYMNAQCMLGRFYEQGRGVGRSLEMARDWYKKAADQGDEFSIKKLETLSHKRRRE